MVDWCYYIPAGNIIVTIILSKRSHFSSYQFTTGLPNKSHTQYLNCTVVYNIEKTFSNRSY